MKQNIPFNEKLFSEIVSLLEASILNPYTKFMDITNYEELAYVLNNMGFKNSKGTQLKGKSIARYIQRMSEQERRRLRDIYYPDLFDETSLTFKRYNIDRITRMQFTDDELKMMSRSLRKDFHVAIQ